MPKIFVSQSKEIAKPVQEVFDKVRDMHGWAEWSPWMIADPECKVTNLDDGYEWDGEICGSGSMVAIGEEPGESIDFDLSFFKPFKSCAKVKMTFAESGEGTEVTWTMDSSLPFFLFWMKKSMEGFIGMDYDRGLNMLKDLMELGEIPSKLTFIGKEPFLGLKGVGFKKECLMDEIEEHMGTDFGKLREAFPDKPGFSSYSKWDVVKKKVSYSIGVEVDEVPAELPTGMEVIEIPACEVYSLTHTGPYRHLGNGWSAGMMHGRSKQFRHKWKIPPFELYEDENDDNPVVRICLPCK